MPAQFSPELDAAIAADYQAGMIRSEICHKHGISATGMRMALIRQNIIPMRRGAPSAVDAAHVGTWPSKEELRAMNAACARYALTMPLTVGASSLGEAG